VLILSSLSKYDNIHMNLKLVNNKCTHNKKFVVQHHVAYHKKFVNIQCYYGAVQTASTEVSEVSRSMKLSVQ